MAPPALAAPAASRAVVLPPPVWRTRQAAHEARVDGWVAAHLERRRAGAKHPVVDFLFTYYSYRPSQLRRWQPGPGVVLAGADPAAFGRHFVEVGAGRVALDTAAVLARRHQSVVAIHRLLAATAAASGFFGCFGLHEWAMVYRQAQGELRHRDFPLRLGPAGTDAVVERSTIRCSHFDAYRFFTPAARPRNLLWPTRAAQAEYEQPACLHANMDLYRWAYQLEPLLGSDVVANCFDLARQIRTVDMRASPYDLARLGLEPIRIEQAEGRAEYVAHQRGFADRAAALRSHLIQACSGLLHPAA